MKRKNKRISRMKERKKWLKTLYTKKKKRKKEESKALWEGAGKIRIEKNKDDVRLNEEKDGEMK